MRTLTVSQKKLLDKWYNEQVARGKTFGYFWDVGRDDDFGGGLYEEIDSLNPCEIFYQNVNNYITSKIK